MVTTIDLAYDPAVETWTVDWVGGRTRIRLGPAVVDTAYHAQRLGLLMLELCEGIGPGEHSERLDRLIEQSTD